MTAYLSQIAARFDGSGVNATAENSNGIQALVPSRVAFDSGKAADIDFIPSTFSNEFTYFDSIDSNDNESVNDDIKMLKPTANFIDPSPVETIRTLFNVENTTAYIDEKSVDQSIDIAPRKKVNSKSQTEIRSDEHVELKPNIEKETEKKVSHHTVKTNSEFPHFKPKRKASIFSTEVQKNQSKEKSTPAEISKRELKESQFPTDIKPISKERFPVESTANISLASIDKKETIRSRPQIKQLKPAAKKQRFDDSNSQKKREENKIQIGSIRVEIIPAKTPKVKTRRQQLPQQRVAPPSKSSVSQTRFPLRFGLNQM